MKDADHKITRNEFVKIQQQQQGEPFQKPVSPTFEQLLRAGEASRWPGSISHMEDDHNHNHNPTPTPAPAPTPHRKSISVLAKVKEKAKKWRHTLSSSSSKKKHCDDGNTTPSWGVSLDDDDDDDDDVDPQHLGAPLYESEIGPQGYKETSIKHPKVVPVTPDRKHVLSSNDVKVSPSPKGTNIKDVQASPKPKANSIKDVQASPTPIPNNEVQATPSPKTKKDVQASHSPKGTTDVNVQASHQHPEGFSPGSVPIQTSQGPSLKAAKTISKTMADKLGPAYASVSDATYVLASKLHSLALSKQETIKPGSQTPKSAPAKISLSPKVKSSDTGIPELPTIATKQAESSSTDVQKSSPGSAPAAVEAGTYLPSAGKHLWDKGVSVKEYIMQKLEPGEDEKALSQVISKAISPKRKDDDATVVEKVREAVTSLLQNQQSSSQPNRSAYHSAQSSTTYIPPLTVTDEVTEAETLERLLQSN
ncbi:low-temperature-induced 65 kDa protein isoform X2 [Euphorbia lathyris]|uniref:low-temperature-induced 65 kDa protein isoform X2 n=1 Tax=Euphorbia lathyris TaxID=212925 RepID=UPI00331437A5